MGRSASVIALALAVGLGGTALARSHARRIRPHIVNGVTTTAYPTVAALLYGTTPDNAGMICSGTLIGCRTLLTAGHCVADDPNAGHYFVFLQHAGVFAVTSVALHPDFEFPVADVAVLGLAPAVSGISPTRIDTAGTFPFGSAATIAGFGRTGGENSDYGIKRAGAAVTASCPAGISNATSACWNFEEPLGAPGTDSSTCNGDSGGPLFIDAGGAPAVAGVTSGGFNLDCLPDDVSYDARVHAYAGFIQSVGGADLANATCGALAQVGSPDVTMSSFAGQVSASSPEGRHAFTVAGQLDTLRVAMNGLDDGLSDFDLYVKRGSPPTTSDYDCRQNGSSQYAFCEFPSPAADTWHVLVHRWSGGGDYQVTVARFGQFCSDPAHEGVACNDGNACTASDVCRAGSCAGTPVANGTSCDDGHICTRDDRCQAGICVAGAAPAPACKRPIASGKGLLSLRDDESAPARDRLLWKWASGTHTDKSEFGAPTTSTPVGLCVYDDRGAGPVLVLEHAIPPGPEWDDTSDGYKYSDRTRAHGGVRTILLRGSPIDGRATITLKAQGAGLGLDLPLVQSPTARLQLVTPNGCWEALYSTHQVSSPERFKARAD